MKLKFDMHVHTNLSSDSNMDLKDAVHAAKNKGLDGLFITNHDFVQGLQGYAKEEFYLMTGCEYSTDAGHILVYFIDEDV